LSKSPDETNLGQKPGIADGVNRIVAIKDANKTASLDVKYRGNSIYSDVNQVFFPIVDDVYGFRLFAEDGITFFDNEFYRVDTVKYTKKYQTYQKYVKPYDELTESEILNDFRGKTETIEKSYYKVNLVKLPTLDRYPMTASFNTALPNPTYFSGSLYFDAGLRGWHDYTMFSPHDITGIMSGSISGLDTLQNPSASFFINGNVFSRD
jgi:hypothetical protein